MHQGRSPHGVDCIGFISLLYQCLDLDLAEILGVKDRTNYGRGADPELIALTGKYLAPAPTPCPGALLLFQWSGERFPRHFGILTDAQTLIHACARRERVVEHSYRSHWTRRTHSAWFLPRVEYASAP